MQSWYSIRAAAGGDGEIHVSDEIGGWGISARQFVEDLQALGAVQTLTVRINSPGGSFFDGVAIYNALARHPARKTVWVDGFAASAASVVAMAGDEIVMPENTMMVIHEPRGAGAGTAADIRVIAEALDRACRSIVSIYAARTERSAEDIEALLAAETWMSAQEAFDLGFTDRIEPAVAIVARFDAQKFRVKHLPADVVTAALFGQGGNGSTQIEMIGFSFDIRGVDQTTAARLLSTRITCIRVRHRRCKGYRQRSPARCRRPRQDRSARANDGTISARHSGRQHRRAVPADQGPRNQDQALASSEPRAPASGHHPRDWTDHRHRHCRDGTGSEGFPLRPPLRSWLGLTPRQNSTGGKERLGGISKQGNCYIRRLLFIGAVGVVRYARRRSPLEEWIRRLLERRPTRLVTIALADKLARIAWAVLARDQNYHPRQPVAA